VPECRSWPRGRSAASNRHTESISRARQLAHAPTSDPSPEHGTIGFDDEFAHQMDATGTGRRDPFATNAIVRGRLPPLTPLATRGAVAM
jgi:hypothetical protein